MQPITAALILCVFACAAYPALVKNRPQFYVAIALTFIIILLDAIIVIFTGGLPGGFARFIYVVIDVLQAITFLALILCAGGIGLHELADGMLDTYEVMRRGDDTKTVIIPRTGEVPKPHVDPTDAPPIKLETPPPPPPDENDREIPPQ